MWLCFNNAFVSAVADRNDATRLVVRARRREHLVALFGKEAEVITSTDSDYKYRIFVARSVVAKLAYDNLMNLSYDNFKNSVSDDTLHDLYSDFWRLHYDIQR